MMKIPASHPRYKSLLYRHRVVDGFRKGFVADAGLIAHGRGEAFDYLIGEKSVKEAIIAQRAAVAAIHLSKNPVISVNGNTAALVPGEVVSLAEVCKAGIEVNLFYRTVKRENLIADILKKHGASEVLGIGDHMKMIQGIESERARADLKGIWSADLVLVPLEDGDRTEALRKMDKCVISIDLNPLSRTSQHATIPIVDNVVRVIPNMIEFAREMSNWGKDRLEETVYGFDKENNLETMISLMREGL